MQSRNKLKIKADTYFFRVSKLSLFFTALFALGILYLVYSMDHSPSIALKYYFAVPEMIKNVFLVCAVAAATGAVFEAGTN